MKTKKPINRGEDNTTLTISLQKDLKARIEEAAAADRRKVSPWCAIQLEKILDEIEAEKGQSNVGSTHFSVAKAAEEERPALMPVQRPVKYSAKKRKA